MLWSLLLATAFLQGSRFTAFASIPDNVEGWYSQSDSWSAVTCDYPQTYVSSSFSSGRYGRCCTDQNSGCNFATSCERNTIYTTGQSTGTYACPTGQTCVVMTIYESATTDQAALDYFCDYEDSWTANVLFRTTDAANTPTGFATVVPRALQTVPFAIPTSFSESNTQDSKSSGSKAWIAGAVIGPIVGCVLIGALAFWLVRRHRVSKISNESESELDHGSQKTYELECGGPMPIAEAPAPIAEAPTPIAEAPTPETEASIPIAELPATTK